MIAAEQGADKASDADDSVSRFFLSRLHSIVCDGGSSSC